MSIAKGIRASILIGVALLLAACGEFSGRNQLAGTRWELRSVGAVSAFPERRPTLSFDSRTELSGNGGCNDFSGEYRAGREGFETGPIMSTLAACAEAEYNEQESAFLDALGEARSYSVTADNVTLAFYGADGQIVLIMGPPGLP